MHLPNSTYQAFTNLLMKLRLLTKSLPLTPLYTWHLACKVPNTSDKSTPEKKKKYMKNKHTEEKNILKKKHIEKNKILKKNILKKKHTEKKTYWKKNILKKKTYWKKTYWKDNIPKKNIPKKNIPKKKHTEKKHTEKEHTGKDILKTKHTGKKHTLIKHTQKKTYQKTNISIFRKKTYGASSYSPTFADQWLTNGWPTFSSFLGRFSSATFILLISPQKRSGNDIREIHSTNHGTPIALGVTCVACDVLTFESLDLVALGLDFANWGQLEERDRRRRWRTCAWFWKTRRWHGCAQTA